MFNRFAQLFTSKKTTPPQSIKPEQKGTPEEQEGMGVPLMPTVAEPPTVAAPDEMVSLEEENSQNESSQRGVEEIELQEKEYSITEGQRVPEQSKTVLQVENEQNKEEKEEVEEKTQDISASVTSRLKSGANKTQIFQYEDEDEDEEKSELNEKSQISASSSASVTKILSKHDKEEKEESKELSNNSDSKSEMDDQPEISIKERRKSFLTEDEMYGDLELDENENPEISQNSSSSLSSDDEDRIPNRYDSEESPHSFVQPQTPGSSASVASSSSISASATSATPSTSKSSNTPAISSSPSSSLSLSSPSHSSVPSSASASVSRSNSHSSVSHSISQPSPSRITTPSVTQPIVSLSSVPTVDKNGIVVREESMLSDANLLKIKTALGNEWKAPVVEKQNGHAISASIEKVSNPKEVINIHPASITASAKSSTDTFKNMFKAWQATHGGETGKMPKLKAPDAATFEVLKAECIKAYPKNQALIDNMKFTPTTPKVDSAVDSTNKSPTMKR